MDLTKINTALDAEFETMDLGRTTARQYLKSLLSNLLQEGECFSGKRPFGNSGWEDELASPLITSGVIEGSLDEDGYPEGFDPSEYGRALDALVEAL